MKQTAALIREAIRLKRQLNLTQAEIGRRLSLSQQKVSSLLFLGKFGERIVYRIEISKISKTAAIRLADEARRASVGRTTKTKLRILTGFLESKASLKHPPFQRGRREVSLKTQIAKAKSEVFFMREEVLETKQRLKRAETELQKVIKKESLAREIIASMTNKNKSPFNVKVTEPKPPQNRQPHAAPPSNDVRFLMESVRSNLGVKIKLSDKMVLLDCMTRELRDSVLDRLTTA